MLNQKELEIVIQQVFSKLKPEEDHSKVLAEVLSLITEIQQKKWSIQKRSQEADDRHDKELADLRKEEIKNQQRCSHYLTKYYPDASGGNDSSTECLICGKEL